MAVKKIICNKVQYAFVHEIESISAGVITLKAGYNLHNLNTQSSTLQQEMKTGDAGPYYDQRLAVSGEDLNFEPGIHSLDIVFQITASDGQTYILGSLEEPARFTGGQRELEGFNFNFQRFTRDEAL